MNPSRPRRDGPSLGPSPRGRIDSGLVRTLALLAAGALGACGGEETPRPFPTPDAPARRVVSLAPSHTELLFALGAGDAVVGVTSFCDRPAAARLRPVVGDAKSVSLETVAALEPDLVVVNAESTEDALGPLGDRVLVLAVPTDSLPQLLDAVGILGAAVGRSDRAQSLRREMEAAVEDAKRRGADRPPTRVLLVVARDPFVVAGGGSYADALLRALGFTNAAGQLGAPWPAVSAEAVVALAPDAIVDASLGPTGRAAGDADARAFWTRYPTIPAVRDGRLRALADEAALRPGPAVGAALRALEESVAPAAGGGK